MVRGAKLAAALAIGMALAIGTVLAPSASPALAFERAIVTGDPSTKLAWPMRAIELRIASDTSGDVAPAPLRAAIARSMTTWSSAAECTDIILLDGGEPSGLRSNLMGGAYDRENRIVFRESEWPSDLEPEALAITTLVYRRSSGEILDADIDLNAVHLAWSADAVPPAGATDVENTITHELGHLLGFAHTGDPSASMYGGSEPGDIAKRDLAPDDIDAVCFVYPRGFITPMGDGPRPPLASGCAVGERGSVLAVALALLGLVAAALRRRRPRAR